MAELHHFMGPEVWISRRGTEHAWLWWISQDYVSLELSVYVLMPCHVGQARRSRALFFETPQCRFGVFTGCHWCSKSSESIYFTETFHSGVSVYRSLLGMTGALLLFGVLLFGTQTGYEPSYRTYRWRQ